MNPHGGGGAKTVEDIFRVSRSADAYDCIALSAQHIKLLRVVVETVHIVGKSAGKSRMTQKGNSRQTGLKDLQHIGSAGIGEAFLHFIGMRTAKDEILHQFADDMFGIGTASAVSAKKKPSAIDKHVFQSRVYIEERAGYGTEFRKTSEKLLRMLIDIVADTHDNLSVDDVCNRYIC